jgi:hypothetical protein
LDAATLEEAAAKVEYMAQVPGAWWLRQSPADVLEPIGTRQSVVWELMFPRGYRKTESTGYQVQWHRNTEDDDKS